jgi:hypothetical protein
MHYDFAANSRIFHQIVSSFKAKTAKCRVIIIQPNLIQLVSTNTRIKKPVKTKTNSRTLMNLKLFRSQLRRLEVRVSYRFNSDVNERRENQVCDCRLADGEMHYVPHA